jgi:hypothetical protein
MEESERQMMRGETAPIITGHKINLKYFQLFVSSE